MKIVFSVSVCYTRNVRERDAAMEERNRTERDEKCDDLVRCRVSLGGLVRPETRATLDPAHDPLSASSFVSILEKTMRKTRVKREK